MTNQYLNLEVESVHTYPSGFSILPLENQIEMLEDLPFGLNGSKARGYSKNLPKLPDGAEDWVAIPTWQKVANTYGEAVELMMKLIGNSRLFKNWCENELGEKHLRQSTRSQKMFTKLAESQGGDIILAPIQFGNRYRGKSIHRARILIDDNDSEFGAGAFIGAVLNYTHPEREQVCGQLHQRYPSDEYRFGNGDHWALSIAFEWALGKLHTGAIWKHNVDAKMGSVSLFLP